jgi:hypothetical protein
VLAAWPGHWGSTLRNNLRRSLKLVERILNGSIGAIRGGTFGAVVITGGAVSIKPLIDRSPCSPGFHGRFQPVQVPPSAGPEACKAGRPFSPTACRTWNGPFVAASVCNAYDLRTALLTGSFRTPPTFAVKTITRGSVDGIDQASGLVQVAGLPLVPRDRVQVFGPAASGTTLTVRAQTRLRVREVVFSELQLEGSPGAIATVEVTRRGGFVLHPGPAVVGGGPRASGGRPGVSGVSSSRVAVSGLRATRTGGTVQIRFVSSTTRALVALTRRPRQGVVAAATPRVKQGQVTVITLKARPSARYVAVAAIGSSGAVGRSRSVAIAPH